MQPAASTALRVVNHISAMVTYWGADLKCVFSNDACRDWLGRTAEEMEALSMAELLGASYEENRRYIQGCLAGRKQVFKSRIPLPTGGIREGIATFTPDVVDGVVVGFSVHVADMTAWHQRESTLAQAIAETIDVLKKTKRNFRSKELGLLRERLEQISRSREDGAGPDGTNSIHATAVNPDSA